MAACDYFVVMLYCILFICGIIFININSIERMWKWKEL